MNKRTADSSNEDILKTNIEELFGSEAVFQQYLQNQYIDEAFSYNLKGRKYRDYSLAHLNNAWIEIITEISENIWTHAHIRMDIESEYLLRRENPPYEDVTDQLEKIEQTAQQLSSAVRKNPDLASRIRNEVTRGRIVPLNNSEKSS
jgi:hypothetical protein